VESVEMGSTQWELTPGCDGDSSPLSHQCPPSPPVMAQPHQMAQASTSMAWPSWPPAHLQAPAVTAKSSYCSTTTSTPKLMALSSYSHPQQSYGGSKTPLASLQTMLDHPPPTPRQQTGGLAELWALPPTTQVPDPPSARSEGLMAPSPVTTGVARPSPSLAPSFLANLIISLPPTNNGGERRLGGTPWPCE
jgi:hypothetical protein